MRKLNLLTRDAAIEIVGLKNVIIVENQNCEPTNRVGVNGKCQNDDEMEWSAQIPFDNDSSLRIYYYTDAASESTEYDWVDQVDFEKCIAGYEIV